MYQFVLWFLHRIADVVQLCLDFKIIGEFSLLHFILGFNFLIIFLKFLRFGSESSIDDISGGLSYRNRENSSDRKKSNVFYNRKTGEVYHPKHARKEV